MKTRTKFFRSPRGLSQTLALAFFALSVIVILISGSLLLLANLQSHRAWIQDRLQLVAQDAAKDVNGFFQDKLGALQTLATLSNALPWYQAANTDNLENFLGAQLAFRQLVILNTEGRDVAHASRLAGGVTTQFLKQFTPEMLAQVQAGKPAVGSVYIDAVASEPVVVIAVPIWEDFGKMQGTLIGELSLTSMWQLMDRLAVGKTGVAYVVDRKGNLLAYKDMIRVMLGDNVANLYPVQHFIGGHENEAPNLLGLTPGIQESNVVGAHVALNTPDWAVIAEMPWEEAYGDFLGTLILATVIMLGIAFLAGLAGLYLARRLSVPLVNLTNTATRITEGELGVQAEVVGPLEVEKLATAFNSMTGRLRQTLAGLEQRVADRTGDLEASKDELTRRSLELERANATLQANSEYLAALNETSIGLMRRLDTNELLGAIVARAAALVNTENGYIYLHDAGALEIELRVGTGLYEGLVGARVRAGEGLAGTVWASGEPVVISDYQNWAGRLQGAQRQNIRAAVGVPLKSGQEVVGVIGLAHGEQGRTFGKDELEVLERFAQLAAIALENARLFEQTQLAYAETQRQARALARLNQGSSELAAAKTFQEVVRIADETVSNVLLPDRVSFAVVLPDGEHFQIYAVQGDVGVTPVGSQFPTAGTSIGAAIQTRRVRYSGDITQDYDSSGLMSVMLRQGLHSIINAPLVSGERVIGTLNVSSKAINKFGEQDISFVFQVASMAATTLEHLRLLEQTQNALSETEVMYRATRDLGSAADIKGLLQVAADFGRTLDMDNVSLALSKPGAQDLDAADFDVHVGFFVGNEFVALPPMPLTKGWGIPEQEYSFTSGQRVVLVPDLDDSPLVAPEYALEQLRASGRRGFCGLVLESEHGRYGYLGFASKEPLTGMPQEKLRHLVAFGNQFETALENRRLYEQTQNALAEAQRLAERERAAAEQLNALNRRLTGEGWQEYLAHEHEGLMVADGQAVTNGHDDEIPELERAAETGGMVISKENGHSMLAVPIVVRGEVIGTVGLEDIDSQQEWSEDRIGIINDVVQNLGLALDNARLYTQSQRRVTELDALNRISQAVTTQLDLNSLLETIGDQVREIFDVQNVYIALYDRDTQMISLPYFVNDNKRVAVEPIHFGEGLTSEIIRTRRPLVMNERTDQKMAELGAKVYGNPAQSYLGVPIFVGDEVTGVISIQNTSREGVFDENNLRLLETIAASIGAAIQNAQLYGAMQQEVLVRQRAEEEIKLSLKEKEVLLKEIHHRVKNNLQIITSLLNLQSAQIKDPEAYTMFRESQARVRSMALIHEKLYQSKDLAGIDFDGYVRDLMVYLFRSYAANPDQIRTEVNTSNLFLSIDTAIPCGLIISELVTNAMKYAFPNGRRGHIYIGMKPHDDGMLTLRVADDGVGFKEDFDWRESDSLGLQLVSTLTLQLHGTIQVSGVNGTSYTLTFPG